MGPDDDKEPSAPAVEAQQESPNPSEVLPEPPYSIFTIGQKRFIVVMASLAALFSPLSANIYYPDLTTLATDLHVSNSLINLTVTSYLVCIILDNCMNKAD